MKVFRWTVDLERIGWCSACKYHVTDSLGESIRLIEGRDLVEKGIEDSLEDFRFKVYAITKYRSDGRYVLYNTRPWVESYVGGKLTVKTRGPGGQGAVLKFYSSEKPSEIMLNFKVLKEGEEWIFDESTRIGTVTYRYVDVKIETMIQIS